MAELELGDTCTDCALRVGTSRGSSNGDGVAEENRGEEHSERERRECALLLGYTELYLYICFPLKTKNFDCCIFLLFCIVIN